MTDAITDFGQFAELRRGADNNDPAVLREVAGQFEALFIQTMMKNMRDTSFGDSIFGQSSQHDMYQEMMDKQLAVEMAGGRGIGLKEILIRQLGGDLQNSNTDEVKPMNQSYEVVDAPIWAKPDEFVRDIWPHAKTAARKLRVSPEGLLAQAALETGWGRHVMRRRDGASSFNLFGIKATGNWEGPTTAKPTLEFRGGVANREVAKFRAYPDVAATFDDYVSVIGTQPRFDSVRDQGSDPVAFAEALQESGYATDPQYAQKIQSILDGKTLRQALQKLKDTVAEPIPITRASQYVN